MRANVFRFAPESGHRAMQSARPKSAINGSGQGKGLFDHLIGAGEDHWRNCNPQRSCESLIDRQQKLSWLFDRKITRWDVIY